MMDWFNFIKDKILGFVEQNIKRWLLHPEHMEHDKKIFLASDEILNERDLRDYLEETASLHSYRACFLSESEKLCRFFEQASNQYLDTAILRKNTDFIRILHNAIDFLAVKFVPVSHEADIDDNFRFIAYTKLHSKLGIRDSEYDNFVRELDRYIKEVAMSYNVYRLLIKQKLLI